METHLSHDKTIQYSNSLSKIKLEKSPSIFYFKAKKSNVKNVKYTCILSIVIFRCL